ncbi:hypothetical protein L210DRAFT_2658380 [Boletus edulis BED1]|uniref:Uncharacterized protein n=1 Tax=Boletus edulis BED1 TaxID=1328754 RepID=A0AAD4C5S2_BOLED|nr:hypothetical protein L210DRAFT_2658380 [Boletus edulis BED1]
MHLQLGSVLESAYCLPIMEMGTWYQIPAFEAYAIYSPRMFDPLVNSHFRYVNSLLGMGLSFCNVTRLQAQYAGGTPLAHYTSTPSLLTRGQMEHAVSRIAAQFIWFAGKLGSTGGGFDRQTAESEITQLILRWRLNINPLPVIAALCASVVLFAVVICMLWDQPSRPGVLSSAGVLGIMWLGSRPQSQMLRDHLREKQNPSVDSLRASSMFKSVFSARPARAHVLNREDSSKCYTAAPSDELGTHASSSGCPDSLEQGAYLTDSQTCSNLPVWS